MLLGIFSCDGSPAQLSALLEQATRHAPLCVTLWLTLARLQPTVERRAGVQARALRALCRARAAAACPATQPLRVALALLDELSAARQLPAARAAAAAMLAPKEQVGLGLGLGLGLGVGLGSGLGLGLANPNPNPKPNLVETAACRPPAPRWWAWARAWARAAAAAC